MPQIQCTSHKKLKMKILIYRYLIKFGRYFLVLTRNGCRNVELQLEDLNLILRERRLRWVGHVERSSGAIRTAYDIQIDSRRGAGRPKQTWKKLTEKDCHEWKPTTVDPQERSTWRSGVRSAMRAASQLPGKGPTDVDDAPAPAH